jgi:hypothetical protein
MGRPSKRAQFVHGMRAYSAHNRLHVNAPKLCRFAQSYIIGKDAGHAGTGLALLRERIGSSSRAASSRWGGLRRSLANVDAVFAARRPCRQLV